MSGFLPKRLDPSPNDGFLDISGFPSESFAGYGLNENKAEELLSLLPKNQLLAGLVSALYPNDPDSLKAPQSPGSPFVLGSSLLSSVF